MARLDKVRNILKEHDSYLAALNGLVSEDIAKRKELNEHQFVDDLVLHVIEELVELRRTYPHKFWKQSAEAVDGDAMLEEAADVYLMFRSLYLEVCNILGINEEEFLDKVLQKAKKNNRRLNNGY